MDILRFLRLLTCLILPLASVATPAFAQRGDKRDHQNMESIVPDELVPPAPVLSVEEALESFAVAPGFVIEPVASAPMVESPVALKFDGDGRMWICEMLGYMPDIDGNGENIPQGRIVILEDTDNDGAADKRTVFLDKLLLPRALYLTADGLLFADQKRLLFVTRDGLKATGEPEVVDDQYASTGNVEHKDNGLLAGLDNWIYSAKSNRRYRRVNGKWEMRPTLFRGQWGITKDDAGRLYYNNNSTLLQGESILPGVLDGNPGAKMKLSAGPRLGSNRVWPARVTPGINRGYISRQNGYDSDMLDPKTYKLINATAACGPEIYRGDNFPETGSAVAFIAECSANLIKAIAIDEDGGWLKGEHLYDDNEFLTSTDERFRPVSLYTAPDGCLYVLDMYHGIIQHRTYVTSYLREYILKQGLDKPGAGQGRIYRIRYQAKPRGPQPQLEGASPETLVKALRHPNGWWRDKAQQLLIQGKDSSVVPALEKLLADHSHPKAQLHAFWTLEGLDALRPTHFKWVLKQGDAPQLVAAALAACLDLPAGTLASLEQSLIDAPTADTLPIYRNRALAELGTPGALQAAVDTLRDNRRLRFLPEATMAGLHGREEAFVTANDARYKNRNFDQWLENSRKSARPTDRPKLTGDHLASFEKGRELYRTTAACIGCHGPEGEGMDNLGPPLDGSEWVTGPEERLVKVLLHGMQGPLTVAGEKYNPPAAMPGLGLNPIIDDTAIAAIATYIRHEWENRAPMVTPAKVRQVRKETADQGGLPYKASDLQ